MKPGPEMSDDGRASGRPLTRREAMRGAAVVGGALVLPSFLAACGDDEAASTGAAGGEKLGGRVIYADGGGTTREARRQAFFDPFEKESGVKVVSTDGDSAKFRLMAERGRSQWDINDYDGYSLIADTKEDLIQKLPESVQRNDLVPEQYHPWVTGAYTQSIVAFYPEGTFNGAQPESWADFWDVDRFPGKRALPSYFYGTIEAALMADGVAPDELFPLDFDRGFAKLDELRPNALFYQDYGQGQQMVQSGATPIGMNFNGRVYALNRQGANMVTIWNQSVFYPWSPQAIPRGAPNPDQAFALLDFMSQAERQAEFSRLTGYGPTNSAALDLLDESVRNELPNAPDHVDVVATVDQEALAKQSEEYIERYSEWVAQG